MQFKVGDRVRGIKDGVTGFGHTGTIMFAYLGNMKWDWYVRFDDIKFSEIAYYERELELVTSIGHFMCHVEGMRGPNYVHDTLELATTEAKRLAGLERGKNVYVLKAVAVVKAEKPVLPEAVVKTL